MSADMNITAAISMPSGDPTHRQVLQQTWSSIGHLMNVSSEQTSFCAPNVVLDAFTSEGSIRPRQ